MPIRRSLVRCQRRVSNAARPAQWYAEAARHERKDVLAHSLRPTNTDQGSMVSLHQFEPCAGSNDDTRSGVVSAALPPDLVETRTYRHATDLDAEVRAGSSDATLEHP